MRTKVVLGAMAAAALVAAAALALDARDLFLTQDRAEAVVRVGRTLARVPAAPHADLLLDYALLSDGVYERQAILGDGTYCAGRTVEGAPCPSGQDLTPYARERLSGWRRIDARLVDRSFACPAHRTFCLRSLSGLGIQTWVRAGARCSEAVIVFRGTDGGQADDWLSNLRWFTRLAPVSDQYDQVQDLIGDVVARIQADGCYRPGETRIVATGHSLGGGLAQQAAYAHPAIAHVYAFDPSFVTGYYDLARKAREDNAKGLRIERVYEHGEILSYPRFLLRYVYPLSTCDPLIRNVRVHTVSGDAIDRHALNSIATALLDWSKARRDSGLGAGDPFADPPDPEPGCAAKDTVKGATQDAVPRAP